MQVKTDEYSLPWDPKDEDQIDQNGSSIRVVEDGAFTISSTIIHGTSQKDKDTKIIMPYFLDPL